MANRAATFSGVMIRPGVSKNNRLYTTEAIGKAVKRMQGRLSDPNALPITVYGSHGEARGDNALGVAARITKVEQDSTGAARFEADVPNTATGRDLASLLTAKDESGKPKPFVRGVSIRGAWMTPPMTIESNGKKVETADDMDIMGFDFTNSPGVEGAQMHIAALAEASTDPLAIFESGEEEFFVDEVTEEEQLSTSPNFAAFQEAAEALANAAALLTEADGSKPYGNVSYADPGYQKDKQKRYPIDSAAHVRAAWSYINQGKNASAYTSAQLAQIKGKIKRAAGKFGINITEEYEQLLADVQNFLEAYASMCVDNGEGSISVSGRTDDPAKLLPMAQRIALATMAGMNALDPDEDGDIDLVMPNGTKDSSSSKLPEAAPAPDDNNMEATCIGCNMTVPAGAMQCPTCSMPIETPGESTADPVSNETKEPQVADPITTPAAVAPEAAPVAVPAPVAPVAAPVAVAPVEAAPVAPTHITLTTEQFSQLLAQHAPAAPAVEAAPVAAPVAAVEPVVLPAPAEPTPAPAVVAVAPEAAPVAPAPVAETTYTAAQVQEMLAQARREDIANGTLPERQGLVSGSQFRQLNESVEPGLEEFAKMSLEELESSASDTLFFDPQWGELKGRMESKHARAVQSRQFA